MCRAWRSRNKKRCDTWHVCRVRMTVFGSSRRAVGKCSARRRLRSLNSFQDKRFRPSTWKVVDMNKRAGHKHTQRRSNVVAVPCCSYYIGNKNSQPRMGNCKNHRFVALGGQSVNDEEGTSNPPGQNTIEAHVSDETQTSRTHYNNTISGI